MNHKLRLLNVFVFEAIAICIIAPLFSFIFNKPISSIGFVAIATSIIAMTGNYLFNLFFDKFLSHKIKRRQLVIRTFLFQIVMFGIFIPFIMLTLNYNFYQSVVYNISGSLFFMVYFYSYNFVFERIVCYCKKT